MSFWIPVAAAAGGYILDRQMGGDGLKGALLGGSLGYGSMGSGSETATAEGGGKGVTSMDSAIPESNTLLGSSSGNMIPSYDVGMEGVKSNIGGFTVLPEANQVVSNSYMPITNSSGQMVGPNMSSTQTFLNTTPETGLSNLGVTQTPDNVGSILTSDVTKQSLNNQVAGYSDGMPDTFRPNFADVTKSTPEEIASAQGGYDKPLYEKAFDSVVGFAEKNPIALATLGMTALGATSAPSPQQVTQSAGQVARQAYQPRQSDILKVRRA